MKDNQCTFCLQFGHRASQCPYKPVKPIQTRETAEKTLKAILSKDVRNHGLRMADIIGIYPC